MSDERSEEEIESTDLFAVDHLVVLHRVLYGTIDEAEALDYLHRHLRKDADLADMGRPLRYQYQANDKIRSLRIMERDIEKRGKRRV